MTRKLVFTAASIGLAGAAAWALIWAFKPVSAGLLPYDDPAAVAKGEALYSEHCASCHGAGLGGEPNWRVPDAQGYMPAPPHDETGHTWHHPDEQLFAITKHGTEALVGGNYRSRMIGYGDILTDQEILATLAYIKSRWPADIIDRHDALNTGER